MSEPATELFNYNKEAFKFNALLHQKTEFQKQKMRVRQFTQYRQDLRDLFNLTIGRMDMYMIVNVLFLGICVEMFYKGRAPVSSPNFIFWLWGVTLASSMFFLLLGLWFALHASVDAQTFSARTLTQWLRLPIPSAKEIAKVTHFVEEFESKGVSQLLRVPIASGASNSVAPDDTAPALTERNRKAEDSLVPKAIAEDWTSFREHFLLFRAIHKNWVVAEAFARVATSVGTNNLLFAIIYFGIMTYGLDLGNSWAAWGIAAIGTVALWLHIKLNLVLNQGETVLVAFLAVLGPVSACIAIAFEDVLLRERSVNVNRVAGYLGVVAVAGHAVLSTIFLYLAVHTVDECRLPKKFSTVWAVDVLAISPEVDSRLMRTRFTRSRGRELNEEFTTAAAMDDADLKRAVKQTEKILQQLFTYWHVNNARLTDEEVSSVIDLKNRFNEERAQVRRMMSTFTVHSGQAGAVAGWIKMAYQPDPNSKRTVPYFLNPETGELRWDLPELPGNMSIDRGISALPETLANYRSAAKAVEERKKEMKLLKETSVTAAAAITPIHLYIYGCIVISLIWLAAVLALVFQLVGVTMGGQLA